MINPGLEDKVVMVTGANNPFGIGASVAKAFAAQKAKVFLHYFRRAELPTSQEESDGSPGEKFYYTQQTKSAGEVLAAIRSGGGQAHAREADLSDQAVIPGLFDQAERTFGPVEILINNAAAWEGDTFLPSLVSQKCVN